MKELVISRRITNKIDLKRYFDDIAKYGILSKEEENSLFIRLHSGDESVRDILIKKNLRFVISVAKYYDGMGFPINDLINVGNIGLLIAIDKFELNKGFKFISYAVWWIRAEITKHISENESLIRIPNHMLGLLSKVKKEAENLRKENDGYVNFDEIIEVISDIGYKTKSGKEMGFKELNNATHFDFFSGDKPIDSENETSIFNTFIDDSVVNPDNNITKNELYSDLERCISKLGKKQQYVIKRLYGFGCESTNIETIAEEMSVSKEQIRIILKKSLLALKNKKNYYIYV